ncbi:hypothetical protein HK103_006654 [Boothiomyces macroporosus]|uniref:Uncharacterized protein n=1 Tax=Boothiomyces macroporosus TaxID=261099 RepID=A0AAD5UDR7_9FUNG|nr:hypothetical protein HK103_006654 [Boothiomyces macroporosus]
MTMITADSEYPSIVMNVKMAISFEYLSLAFAGIGMTVLISHFIEGALGSNQSIYTLLGQDYNPINVLKVVRLIIFLYSLVLYILWFELGLKSEHDYQLVRSIIYYSYTIITAIVSPIMYGYFIGKIITKLTEKFEVNGVDPPPSLNYLILFKKILTRSYTVAVTISMFIKAFGNQYFFSNILPWQVASNSLLAYSSTILVFYAIYKSFPTTVNKIRMKITGKSELGIKLRPSVAEVRSKTVAAPANTIVIRSAE